jgi:hypothetical protein
MFRKLLCLSLLSLSLVTPTARPDDKDVPEGFMPLFNGKDLTGWKVYGGKPETWGAEDGTLFTKSGGGGWLMTEKEHSDFELMLEFKLTKNGNSGVALRAPLSGDPAYSGMEIQVLDDDGPDYKSLKPAQYCGSIYGVVPPAEHANKPVGQWNKMHIIAKGRQIVVEVNGKKLVDANLDDYKDKHAKDHPGILREKGHIGLQSHTDRVEFRNIYFKPL